MMQIILNKNVTEGTKRKLFKKPFTVCCFFFTVFNMKKNRNIVVQN